MFESSNKRTIATITFMTLSIISTSFVTTANANGTQNTYNSYSNNNSNQANTGSYSSGRSTANSNDFNWGHPCNRYGPVGSVNIRGVGSNNPSACSDWLGGGGTINPFGPNNR